MSRYLFLVRKSEREVEWVKEEVAKPEKLRVKISALRSRSPKKKQRATDINPHEDIETDGLSETATQINLYDSGLEESNKCRFGRSRLDISAGEHSTAL